MRHAELDSLLDPWSGQVDFERPEVIALQPYMPTTPGVVSNLTGEVLSTAQAALNHALHLRDAMQLEAKEREQAEQSAKEREEQSRKGYKDGTPRADYIQACQSRQAFIDAKRQEWKDAVEAAKAAKAQWDVYVKQKHQEFKDARATPVPRRDD